jgi:NodT family efflux transporter outer membrane factor (OMF) lipoprotein
MCERVRPGPPRAASAAVAALHRGRPGRALRLVAWVAGAALASGCTVGPDYRKPTLDVPGQFRQAEGWKPAQPADHVVRGAWWNDFGDPVLAELLARVGDANPNVRIAQAQFAQARAVTQQARATLFPTLGTSVSATRSRAPSLANRPILVGGPINNYDAQADVAWEPDLWGRVRRNVEAGRASESAAEADLASVRLAAEAELAQNYVLLRVADEEKRLLDEAATAWARNLVLVENRYAAGLVAKSDVVQARTQRDTTRAQSIDLAVQRAQLEHGIALLLGEAPARFALAPAVFVTQAPVVPPGVPSALLERRPDIAAAERRVAAANAQIGVAMAAFYPDLTLTGAIGYRNTAYSRWLDAPSRFWSVGPSLALTLFDGGARRAVKAQAEAAHAAETERYKLAVLTGFREVEDSLVALRLLGEEADVQAQAVADARESLKLTRNRYAAGVASALDVIATQNIALDNERTAASLRGRQVTAAIQLVKATGGGWR